MSRPARSKLLRGKGSQAPVFAALGDPTRLAMVGKLCSGDEPFSISQLTEDTKLTRQAVTKHLRVLERAGIVRCRRKGRESLFSFDPEPIDHLRDYLDRVSAQWDQTLERLRKLVEN